MADALRARGHDVVREEFTTTGDRWSASHSDGPADKGMFVKELEAALLDGRADVAVHSAKDVPADLPEGLVIAAVPGRADARDVLLGVTGGLDGLAAGMRIGTGSPRRRAQIHAACQGLETVEIRGNVDTRLDRLSVGDLSGIVLAAAGLARLGRARPDAVALPVDRFTPAPGQGFLALEARAGDARVLDALAALHDAAAGACLDAERAVLRGLGGGCLSPVGAHCAVTGGAAEMTVFVAADASGAHARRVTARAASPTDAARDALGRLGGGQ